jgi:O-antigen/teichoic acid export membrane protein
MSQKKCGALLGYVSIILNNGILIFLIPFLITKMGQEEYGLYTIVGSFLATLTIMDMGLASAVIRFIVKYRVNKDQKSEENFIAVSLMLYALLALITFFLGLAIKNQLPFFFKSSLNSTQIIQMQSMVFILFINIAFSLSLNSFKGILAAYECFIFIKCLEILRVIFRTALLILTLSCGYKAMGVIIVDTACNISASLIMVLYTLFGLKIRIKLHNLSITLLKEVFSFSIFIFLNVIAGEFYWRISVILVGALTNPVITSVYSIGSQISSYLITFSSNVAYIIGPSVVFLVERKASDKALTDVLIKMGRLQSYALYLIFTIFVFFGKKFIDLWVGKGFEQVYYIAIFIMLPLIFILAQNTGIKILEAKCKHGFRSVVMLSMSIFNIILTYFLVKKYGVVGGAISSGFCLFVGNLIILNIYYHKHIKLDIVRYYKEVNFKILLVTLLSCVGGFLLSLYREISWGTLSYQVLLYIIIFLTLQYILVMNSYEKKFFKNIYKKMVSFIKVGFLHGT